MAKSKKHRVARTRADNTLTEAEFWGMIRSALRRRTVYWKPMSIVKQEARREYVGDNKRQKWEYQCAMCKNWFKDKEIEVDHLIPAGSLTCGDDLKDFVEKLFCEKEHLRVLCKECHKGVTKIQRGNR